TARGARQPRGPWPSHRSPGPHRPCAAQCHHRVIDTRTGACRRRRHRPALRNTGVLVTVARITSPHGLRGWVRLEVRTDRPEERLSSGNRLLTEPASVGPLTIEAARLGPEGDYVRFAEVG